MEEDKKFLDNTNQCKSIYTILKEFIISIYIKIKPFIVEWNLIITIAFFAMLIIFIFGYFYFSEQNLIKISKNAAELGQMGDFFGGTLNPILAFLSFCLLMITIKFQSKELKSSTEELKKSSKALKKQSKSLKVQNFETTFFNLINLHNKLVDNFSFEKVTFGYIQKTLKDNKESNFNDKPIFYKEEAFKILCKDIEEESKTDALYFTKFNEVYNEYYIKKQNIVNKYFENIHQIFKFISNSKFNKNEKKKYSDIFRVQFSQDELKLLFYHCINSKARNTLKPYIEKFSFFEFLIFEEENKNFLFIINKDIYDIRAFGYNSLIVENIKKLTNEYLEETGLKVDRRTSFNDYKKYCSYCFILEKYDLALEKFEELEKYYEPTIKEYGNIHTANENVNNIRNNYKILKSYIVQIKKYLNTSSKEQQ